MANIHFCARTQETKSKGMLGLPNHRTYGPHFKVVPEDHP